MTSALSGTATPPDQHTMSEPPSKNRSNRLYLLVMWPGGLIVFITALDYMSRHFGYATAVPQMPIRTVTALMIGAGLLYLLCLWSLLRQPDRSVLASLAGWLTPMIVLAGLFARLFLLTSTPVLEDDYQRYLWDGAVLAQGINPYKYSPQEIAAWRAGRADGSQQGTALSREQTILLQLARQSHPVFDRINHPHYRTIYPPVAEAGFALSHMLSGFSLIGWRLFLIACELAGLVILVRLLRQFDLSPLYAMLYWLNPLVVKEIANSAHMDAMLVPLILAFIYLVVNEYRRSAAVILALAVGVKLWPAVLAVFLFWNRTGDWRKGLLPVVIFIVCCGAIFWPVFLVPMDEASGFVAYARFWTTNNGWILPVTWGISKAGQLICGSCMTPALAALMARGLAAIGLGLFALVLAWRGAARDHEEVSDRDWMRSIVFVIFAVFLLSPAQFPWYFVWIAPVLALVPVTGLLLLGALLPLYYGGFYFMVTQNMGVFQWGVVYLIWGPVWLSLLYAGIRRWKPTPQ